MSITPQVAMVLAAGLGTRMRPLTDVIPKPLVRLAGRTLLDHVLDRIAGAHIAEAVVNVHYLARSIEAHLAGRLNPSIRISDERDMLLDTGGGVCKALPLLGDGPFLIHNADSVWIETSDANIARLCNHWDDGRMDGLLLLADRATSLGYCGLGDFNLAADSRVSRPPQGAAAPYVFAGVSLANPRLMRDPPSGAFSLNRLWDRAMTEGRLFGLRLEGTWMHVGDPASLADAEKLMARTHTN